MSVPRTTHQWLQALYDWLDDADGAVYPSGNTGIPQALILGQAPVVRVGNATGVMGLYGFSGIAQVATGGNGIFAATSLGASGLPGTGMGGSGLYTFLGRAAFNGGTGTPYTHNDVVLALKNIGILPA